MLEGRIKFSKNVRNDCLLHALMARADRDMPSSGGDERCGLPVKRKTTDDGTGTGTADVSVFRRSPFHDDSLLSPPCIRHSIGRPIGLLCVSGDFGLRCLVSPCGVIVVYV